ncbi:MAG: hypothetical protein WDO24_05535 [Pseudomonadota bacterium]
MAAATVWVSGAETARAQDGAALFRRPVRGCHTVEAGKNKIRPVARRQSRARRPARCRISSSPTR